MLFSGEKKQKKTYLDGERPRGLLEEEVGDSETTPLTIRLSSRFFNKVADTDMEGGRRPAHHGRIKVRNNEYVYFQPTEASIANIRVDSAGNKVILPKCKENWRSSTYVTDRHGYVYTDDHFRSDDEVSEDDDDGDDAEKKESVVETISAGVACMTDELSAMEVGISPDTTSTECIRLPPHDPESVFLVTFDGHHKKNNNGGYGEMLRCDNGRSVAAAAGGSKCCISAFYHILEGFLSGINLAILGNVPAVFFACNSKRVFETLWEFFIFNSEGSCRHHPDEPFDLVCRTCLNWELTLEEQVYEDYFYDIVRKIVGKGQRYYRDRGMLNAYLKEWNRPADYLAKLVRCPGEERKLKPEEFPDELRDLVDQHGGEIPFSYN
ncbi:hypothetical protein MKW98_019420 [Papaver atlanticum]|uniref:Uncharacterized protein n=1 Tax=Papaver atlanticum TaxID=357466 RepID=A0AAD4S9B8_9MAGN|nr:hypothetical protein MKW98_019420 [Papaver atlanticum]